MERDKPAPTACHNDLLSENFILDADGKMWVIDWEYGGMTDPYFDLGDFCVEHPLSAAEEERVLTAVLWRDGRAPLQPHDAAQARRRSVVEHLGHDPVRVSKIDFDFYEYGMNRIRRFCDNATHAGFETWLAEV